MPISSFAFLGYPVTLTQSGKDVDHAAATEFTDAAGTSFGSLFIGNTTQFMALIQRQAGFSLSRLLFGSPSTSTPPRPLSPLLSTIALPSITIQIPGFLSDIWEGILKAVPKKKTSHAKRRHRQLAGKALKDVKSVNSCPGCGRPKRAHFLCPYCVAEIKQSWLDKRLNKIPEDDK